MTLLVVLLVILLVVSLAGLWMLLGHRRSVVEDVADLTAEKTVQEALRRLEPR